MYQDEVCHGQGESGELEDHLVREPCRHGSDAEALHHQGDGANVGQHHSCLVGRQPKLLNGND